MHVAPALSSLRTAGHGDSSARRYHPRAGEDAQLHGPRHVDRETIRRADVPDGGDAGAEVQRGVFRAAERGQGTALLLHDLVGFGGGAPDQVDVGVDEAGQERRVAEVHHPCTGGWLPSRSYRDDAPALHEDRTILHNLLREPVENTGRPVLYGHDTSFRRFEFHLSSTGILIAVG